MYNFFGARGTGSPGGGGVQLRIAMRGVGETTDSAPTIHYTCRDSALFYLCINVLFLTPFLHSQLVAVAADAIKGHNWIFRFFLYQSVRNMSLTQLLQPFNFGFKFIIENLLPYQRCGESLALRIVDTESCQLHASLVRGSLRLLISLKQRIVF